MGWFFNWLWRSRDGVELKVVVFVLDGGWFMLEGWELKLFALLFMLTPPAITTQTLQSHQDPLKQVISPKE
jgi:hypothetical protein